MKKLQQMTEKELLMQEALGSLSEEYRNNLCRYKTPEISKGVRKCNLCGLKCINKGDEFYRINLSGNHWGGRSLNICKSCSWLTIQTINKISVKYNNQFE